MQHQQSHEGEDDPDHDRAARIAAQERDLEKGDEDEGGVLDQRGEGGFRHAQPEHLAAHHRRVHEPEQHAVPHAAPVGAFHAAAEEQQQDQEGGDEAHAQDVEGGERGHGELGDDEGGAAREDHGGHEQLGLPQTQLLRGAC